MSSAATGSPYTVTGAPSPGTSAGWASSASASDQDYQDASYSTVLATAGHGEFAAFQPGGGISMGFDDLKVIEAERLVAVDRGGQAGRRDDARRAARCPGRRGDADVGRRTQVGGAMTRENRSRRCGHDGRRPRAHAPAEQVPGLRGRRRCTTPTPIAPASCRARSRRHRAAPAEALIASPDVDAVVICSPDFTHAELVLACLEAGKPVMCEKPLALTSRGVARLWSTRR